MKQVGVCLAGCGFLDGAEIREAVLTLLSIDRLGAAARCFAPDMEQMHVVDHLRGEPAEGQSRNVLVESARIARGDIQSLDELNLDELDALIFPGGFGVAKNLCDFAIHGADCRVNPQVEAIVKEAKARNLPMGFLCIAPALAAAIFKGQPCAELTIGSDPGTADALQAMGATHVDTSPQQAHVDSANKIVSTAAYMCDAPLSQIADGIHELVVQTLALTE
ncbi:MAG: isoprenoid biosynthesis glyoxalase ElbB [Planctomycetes bacterium]|nr:isoprenoid biosynthesis glyoxalase ElbB [Planctomycetota bacterium]